MGGANDARPSSPWVILTALCAIVLVSQGMAHFGGPVINAYMAQSLSLDRAALGSVLSAYMIAMSVGSLSLATLESRLGAKRTLVLGGFFLLCGAGALSLLVNDVGSAALSYGAGIGLGVSLGGQLPAQAIAATWFEKNRALAFALIGGAAGVGGTIAPPLFGWVIAAGGTWRAAWAVLAGLACLSIVLALLFAKSKQQAGDAHASVDQAQAFPSGEYTVASALRSPIAWLIFAAELGPTIGFHIFLAHAFPHLNDLGHSPAKAAGVMSIVTLTFVLGNIFVGVLGVRIETRRIWIGINALFALGMVLFARPTSDWQLYLAVLCIGAGFGGSIVSMMTVLANYFGARALLGLSGVAVAVQMSFGAAAPTLAGMIYDRLHDYGLAFYVSAGIAIAGAVILLLVDKPARKGGVAEAA